MGFLSEADLLHEDSGWTVVALPNNNHKLPCSQQVQEQWHQLNQHQALGCSFEPSHQLISWQQVVQQLALAPSAEHTGLAGVVQQS